MDEIQAPQQALVSPAMRVLDVGCGKGHFLLLDCPGEVGRLEPETFAPQRSEK